MGSTAMPSNMEPLAEPSRSRLGGLTEPRASWHLCWHSRRRKKRSLSVKTRKKQSKYQHFGQIPKFPYGCWKYSVSFMQPLVREIPDDVGKSVNTWASCLCWMSCQRTASSLINMARKSCVSLYFHASRHLPIHPFTHPSVRAFL